MERHGGRQGRNSPDEGPDFFIWNYLAEQEAEADSRRAVNARLGELSRQTAAVAEALDGQLSAFLSQLRALGAGASALQTLAEKTAFYEMTAGLRERGEWIPPFAEILQALCVQRGGPCAPRDVEAAFRAQAPMFREEGALTPGECGKFWAALFPLLPASPRCAGEGYPPALFGLFELAEALEADFAGVGGSSPGLYECFAAHHRRHCLLHPDTAALEDAVRRQDFSAFPFTDVYRDLLTASFPEPGRWWSCEALAGMDAEALLAAVYQKDAALSVRMWRLLLDTADERLGDPAAADGLVGLEIAGHCSRVRAWDCEGRFDPILDELKRDSRFARQLYQSASIRGYPESLLVVCCARGRTALMARLRALLGSSPYLAGLRPNGLPRWMRALPEREP